MTQFKKQAEEIVHKSKWDNCDGFNSNTMLEIDKEWLEDKIAQSLEQAYQKGRDDVREIATEALEFYSVIGSNISLPIELCGVLSERAREALNVINKKP